MSLSKKHKAYKATGGTLSFAEWVVLYDRLAGARAARGSSKAQKRAIKAKAVKAVTPQYERVENRVDCFGTTKKGVTILGADASDGEVVARLCMGGKVVSMYTSKRGERARIESRNMNTRVTKAQAIDNLVAAGFTPKGF